MFTREILLLFILVVTAITQVAWIIWSGGMIQKLHNANQKADKLNTELGHLIEWMDNCLPQK